MTIIYICDECGNIEELKDVCVTYTTFKALIEKITVEAICAQCKHSVIIDNYHL